ncbi:hypothetical protein [Nostoc sp. WHI]|uniref:hypothetical protein n=1 Tax=Nostoc sp. WHI TaxID=2650611 RepID=UPI0018C6B339|nr:hypothetical protein [Nostoc sp. WHI]MBG1266669.1 hypothetical protein [Nostoc sp. WHI]
MSLPKDFELIIKEEYGNFGWELANCFSCIAEFLGYKVLDISSVKTALKIVSNIHGSSLKGITGHPKNLSIYLKAQYPQTHQSFVKRAETLKKDDEDDEFQRQQEVSVKFAKYIINKDSDFILFMIDEFYRSFVLDTLSNSMFEWLLDIEETINKKSE